MRCRIHHRNCVFPAPQFVGETGSHGRSDAQRLMDADEIVIDEIERQSVAMVVELLREGVGEAREAAH